jgi:hypothetical protein
MVKMEEKELTFGRVNSLKIICMGLEDISRFIPQVVLRSTLVISKKVGLMGTANTLSTLVTYVMRVYLMVVIT